MKPLILVVDDETQMRGIVRYALEQSGYDVLESSDSASAWKIIKTTELSLIVLDLMLPDMSGVELAKRLRAEAKTPILMLSALGDSSHRIDGLDAGADDYLPKPFSPRELVLRVQAIMRRTGNAIPVSHTLEQGPLKLDTSRGKAYYDSKDLELSETEYRMLRALFHAEGEPVTVRELLNQVWETTSTSGGRDMVKTTVYRLRRKLRAISGSDDLIHSLRGGGYVLEVPK